MLDRVFYPAFIESNSWMGVSESKDSVMLSGGGFPRASGGPSSASFALDGSGAGDRGPQEPGVGSWGGRDRSRNILCFFGYSDCGSAPTAFICRLCRGSPMQSASGWGFVMAAANPLNRLNLRRTTLSGSGVAVEGICFSKFAKKADPPLRKIH